MARKRRVGGESKLVEKSFNSFKLTNRHLYVFTKTRLTCLQLEMYCRSAADELGIYLDSAQCRTIDNMLQLLISAGILSFG